MRKTPKNIGGYEKLSAAKQLDTIAASLGASPTAGGHTQTAREKATDEGSNQANKEKGNAPALPRELRQQPFNWTRAFSIIGTILAVVIPLGGLIVWFAKLDSKVDTTATDVAVIKPKVDQLLINSEKQDVRLGNLENNQPIRDKTGTQKNNGTK